MPTTNSPKGSAIPVRPTPQMRQQLDELIAAGWGNASDIIRIAVHDMHKREIKHMNSGLTDNEWVKRVNEIRQMVADVPVVPVSTHDVEFYIEQFGLEYDDEKKVARREFSRKYDVPLIE